MKTRTAFYLHTNFTTKLSRRLCRDLIRSKKAARLPSFAINLAAVKQECRYSLFYICFLIQYPDIISFLNNMTDNIYLCLTTDISVVRHPRWLFKDPITFFK